jgi:thiosulfate dehydrogenase (quinone) large subunit
MPPDARSKWSVRAPDLALLPLRGFLGLTFVFAGLQKLSDPNFFDSSAAASIQTQLRSSERTSPIGTLLHGSSHFAVLLGVVIALAEVAVGVGALLGLWTRWAAAGGAALSAGFLLAVSWHTRPYYYGADVVFLFAWIPILIAGSGWYSLDRLLLERARRELRIPPLGPVSIDFGIVRRLCGAYDAGRCKQRGGAECAVAPCPVLAKHVELKPSVAAGVNRREFLLRARTVGGIGAGALVVTGATAVLGRLFAPARHRSLVPTLNARGAATTTPSSATAPTSSPATTPTTAAPPAGTAIGSASAVPVGGAAAFNDPGNGEPAYVLQPSTGQYVAVNAVCTHAGCTVQYQSPHGLVCPCHGAEFDALTGAVLRGPAPTPLPMIPITVGADGRLYVQG